MAQDIKDMRDGPEAADDAPKSAYFIDDHAGDAIVRRTLAAIVTNEPGVLARVVSLFAARGYNIESLTVAETDLGLAPLTHHHRDDGNDPHHRPDQGPA